MKKISVVINTLNEEKNLPRAIASVADFADEIVVVDMHSTDDTVRVAESLGAKVFEHEGVGYVEPTRNFAISKAQNEWIFILDADEEVSLGLKKALKKIVENSKADYYRIPRKNIIFGKWIKHSRWWPDYNIRLFKKGSVSWSEIIHSVPLTKGQGLDIGESEENAITHHHYDTIEQYIERLNRYTTLHAKNHIKDGYKFNWSDLIVKPVNEFLSRYFQGEGYKDGLHGLALCGLQGFSEFVMYLKIWSLVGKTEGETKYTIANVISVMKKAEADIHYWEADVLLKNGGSLINIIKRKFRLG